MPEQSAETARPLYTPCPSCLLRHDPLGPCIADDPTYCWADPDGRHQWDGRGVCNDSGRTLAYICRWCTREVAEIPTSPGSPS